MVELELMDTTGTLLNEIKQGVTRDKLAHAYALAIKFSYKTDWEKVNNAIIEHWSISGLNYIKGEAWSIIKCVERLKKHGIL